MAGIDPILGSVALIETGLGVLSWRVKEYEKTVSSDFWNLLLELAFTIWVRRCSPFSDTTQRTMVRCMAWAYALFEKDIEKHFATFANMVGESHELLSHIALTLHANGIVATQLAAMFKASSLSLSTTLDEVIKWAELTKKNDQIGLAMQCRELLKELQT